MSSSSSSDDDNALLHSLVDSNVSDQIAVIYDTGTISRTLTYKMLENVAKIIESKLKGSDCEGGFIGVIMKQQEVFPAVLIGILRAGMGFYCMNSDADEDELMVLEILKVRMVFTDEDGVLPGFPAIEEFIPVENVVSEVSKLRLLTIAPDQGKQKMGRNRLGVNVEPFTLQPFEWAYAICTSGTTSQRKLVLVSHQAIVPNILDFTERFQLGRKDVIFCISPATFDPHVVDIFMGLSSGSTLLYSPKSTKLISDKFTQLCSKHKVTVIQCTPSLFLRFDIEETLKFFTNNQQLRILAFGGEPCPSRNYLHQMVGNRKNLTTYNLYGTTELSCWVSSTTVELDNNNDAEEIEILRNLVPDTYYKIVDNCQKEKEILLGSKHRRCLVLRCVNWGIDPPVDQEDGIIFRRTGDIIDHEELPRLVYKGRTDRKFKRQGHFVDLRDLEQRLISIPFVANVITFEDFGKIYAIISLLNNSSIQEFEQDRSKLFTQIQVRVPIKSLPDHVIVLHPNKIPLTENGKVDLKQLKELILKNKMGISETRDIKLDYEDFVTVLKIAWELFTGSSTSSLEELMQMNFVEAGGDSNKAMLFVEYVFQELNHFGTSLQQYYSTEIIRKLIQSKFSEVLNFFQNVILPGLVHQIDVSSNSMTNSMSIPEVFKDKISGDIGLDGADLFLDVTKYAPEVIALLTDKPGSQVDHDEVGTDSDNHCQSESRALVRYPYQVAYNLLGCVDYTPILIEHPKCGEILVGASSSGNVITIKLPIAFDSPGSNVLWTKKFPDHILSSVGVSRDRLTLFIACCDCRLYAVEAETGNIMWYFNSGSVLLTRPLVVDESLVIFTADSGWIFAVNNGSTVWKLELPGLKSSFKPLLTCGHIFLTSDTGITRVNPFNGNITSFYPLKNIYTNFASNNEGELICVGTISEDASDDRLLHVLKIEALELIELWNIGGNETYNTPIFFSMPGREESLFYVTTNGRLCVHNAVTGEMYSEVDLGTTVASTPTFFQSEINETWIVIPSKDGREKKRLELFFIKVSNRLDGSIFLSFDVQQDVMSFRSPYCEPILCTILVVGENVVFGRRDDRLYFINWAVWHKAMTMNLKSKC